MECRLSTVQGEEDRLPTVKEEEEECTCSVQDDYQVFSDHLEEPTPLTRPDTELKEDAALLLQFYNKLIDEGYLDDKPGLHLVIESLQSLSEE